MKKIKEISKINQELINKKEIKFGRSLTISEILEITNKFKFIYKNLLIKLRKK